MAETKYDIKDQYNRVKKYIIPGESLQAVFDCKGGGTGFVGISDQRIIFYDQAFLKKKKSMVSVPYHQVVAVASSDEGGLIFKSSELTLITSAGNFTFEFRGSDKAHWAYNYIMNQILNQVNPQLPDEIIESGKARNETEISNNTEIETETNDQPKIAADKEEFKAFCLLCQKSTLQYRDSDGNVRCKKCGEVVPTKL